MDNEIDESNSGYGTDLTDNLLFKATKLVYYIRLCRGELSTFDYYMRLSSLVERFGD